MAKQKRIMESMIGAFYIGRSKKDDIREGWYWGVMDVFGSRRNTKKHLDVPLGKKQHRLWVYNNRNGLQHNHVIQIYKDRLNRNKTILKYFKYTKENKAWECTTQ